VAASRLRLKIGGKAVEVCCEERATNLREAHASAQAAQQPARA
jgi:hypothetical protein